MLALETTVGLLRFLRTAPEIKVDWFISFGRSDTLKVVPWKMSGDGNWALHLNLKSLGQSGEEAYIPFPWADGKPTVSEAVTVFRTIEVTHV